MQILGTRTHYQPVKPFQERLDSDHVMDLEELKKQQPESDRATLNWLNPKADVKVRVKNKRKYYSYLSKLRTPSPTQAPTRATTPTTTPSTTTPTTTPSPSSAKRQSTPPSR
jgi:hypothetical protein